MARMWSVPRAAPGHSGRDFHEILAIDSHNSSIYGPAVTSFRTSLAVCLALTLSGAALAGACNSDAPDGGGEAGQVGSGGRVGSGGAGSEGGEGGGGSGPESHSAVLVAGQAYTPEDYLTYVRVFPEVPEGDFDFGSFREFGNANVSVHEGRVFVEQDGVMQRFDVSEDLELVDGPRFTWADFGISSANASYTVFISATRAYTFAPQLGIIVVWDPDEMVRTGVIELELPEGREGLDTWASDGYVIGDKVVWNVFSGDWDTPRPYPGLTLAIADAHANDPPIFVEDSRCLPGGPSFVDENGDYYVHGAGYFGYFYAYGQDLPDGIDTCILRVKAGETDFDPDYELDYETVTGTPVNTPWIQVTGDQYITRAWDPSVPFPESQDDFWVEPLRPLLVDQGEGTSEPYPDLEGFFDIDGVTRIVDGVSYFQISETGYDVGGNAEVVELHPDGTRPKFRLTAGFLLALERVR